MRRQRRSESLLRSLHGILEPQLRVGKVACGHARFDQKARRSPIDAGGNGMQPVLRLARIFASSASILSQMAGRPKPSRVMSAALTICAGRAPVASPIAADESRAAAVDRVVRQHGRDDLAVQPMPRVLLDRKGLAHLGREVVGERALAIGIVGKVGSDQLIEQDELA